MVQFIKMKKYISIALFLLVIPFCTLFAQNDSLLHCVKKNSHTHNKAMNSRSDSIDVLNYSINLDLTNYSGKFIKGFCDVKFTPKLNNILVLDLDLLKLNIDSIKEGNTLLSYTYNDTLLKINFVSPMNVGDTSTVRVFYKGNPVTDNSGWGGFYFQNNYIFNLGVGFDALPHNYGRVWFPCFDNFVERSTYNFTIKTANNMRAHCNGYMQNEVLLGGDTVVRTWGMNYEIPTYLACVAAANYVTVQYTHPALSGNIPVELAALPGDTNNLKASFSKLGISIDAFEHWFGPYLWNKVGYSLVPFGSGAMEHATNIAYPKAAANGSLAYETLMAHELAHHWWGDLATCETAQEMWINEGMAEYASQLFLNFAYDYKKYIDAVRSNHADVIQYAHIKEGGFLALNNIPLQYTYGQHVYNKGASVVHNLRTYLGDSNFITGLKSITTNYAYKSINSTQFRDEINNSTGKNVNDFFNHWIFNEGFPHFSIDSIKSQPLGGNFSVTVYVKQKLKGAPFFFNNVPIQISFYNNNWNKITDTLFASGQYSTFNSTLPFNPAFTCLNENSGINQAITDEQFILKTSGNKNFTLAKMNLTVNSITDSALVRIEHHFVAPDSIKNNPNDYIISENRYWSVDGIWPQHFKANASVYYDGRNITSGGGGWLDHDLVLNTEDSLILLYRKGPHTDWEHFPYYSKNVIGNNNNAFGQIKIDSLWKGEYTFANSAEGLSIKKNKDEQNEITVFPNPSKHYFTVRLNEKDCEIQVRDMNGKIITTKKAGFETVIETDKWSKGSYFITVIKDQKRIGSSKLILE